MVSHIFETIFLLFKFERMKNEVIKYKFDKSSYNVSIIIIQIIYIILFDIKKNICLLIG